MLILEGIYSVDNDFYKQFTCTCLHNYIDKYYDSDIGLCHTTRQPCSRYWEGGSILASSHLLFLLIDSSCSYENSIANSLFQNLIQSQNKNYLWTSKWITNDYYTTFFIIRAIVRHNQKSIEVKKIVSQLHRILINKLRLSSRSQMCPVSAAFIILTLSFISNTYKHSNMSYKLCTDWLDLAKERFSTMQKDLSGNNQPLLYYWQDVKSQSIKESRKLFVSSIPKSSLIEIFYKLAKSELTNFERTYSI